MWYLYLYARPFVLIAYMIGVFFIPIISIEILLFSLTGLNWEAFWA
jgi:hypothetical protein